MKKKKPSLLNENDVFNLKQIDWALNQNEEESVSQASLRYGDMPDEDDRVFYEVALSEEDSFLVTGNLKHFPKTPKVVTAAQMMEILDHEE